MAARKKEVAATAAGKNKKGGVQKQAGTSRKHAKKDKDAPKRGKSAFMCFSIERRKQLVQETPSLSSQITEISKIIGGEWGRMTESDKKPYEKLAVLDKQRYEREKAAYVKNKSE